MRLKFQVKLRFIIDQKDSLETLLLIMPIWGMRLTNRKLIDPEDKGMHRIETDSFIKVCFAKAIRDYLTQFGLKTKKKESFKI